MNISFHLAPHVGVGVINFDDSRDSVRKSLGTNYDIFTRTSTSINSTDHFRDLGVFVYYDEKDRVEAVEFTSPAIFCLDELNLFTKSCSKIIELISTIDSEVEKRNNMFISHRLGLSGYMPDSFKSKKIPESLLAFRPDYYA